MFAERGVGGGVVVDVRRVVRAEGGRGVVAIISGVGELGCCSWDGGGGIVVVMVVVVVVVVDGRVEAELEV